MAKEVQNLNNDNFVNITSVDANAAANFKLREKSIPVNYQIYNISGDFLITKTIARLRTCHYRGNKFNKDGRSYRSYDCLDTELTTANILTVQLSCCSTKNWAFLFVNKSLCGQY
ncbi:hypothetical protein TNCV_5068161 [Trichonephila clavipes]|nr:hypothetical protein TNCV_5068161 [Trichonephila clavipes]